MIANPRLYAVVDRGTPCRRVPLPELRQQKRNELHGKRAIDRADAVLERLEIRVADYKARIAALQSRKALAEARIERLKDGILARMDQAQLTTVPGFGVTFTAKPCPPSLEVFDESLIPEEYIDEEIVSTPNKMAIKAVLKRAANKKATAEEIAAAASIGGVRLMQKTSLVRTKA